LGMVALTPRRLPAEELSTLLYYSTLMKIGFVYVVPPEVTTSMR